MIIYGFLGFTHGWGTVLTVMSQEGATAARAAIDAAIDTATGINSEVRVTANEGQLIQYFEKRDGALERLIAEHNIVVLDKAAWDAKKAELGDKIWR